VPADPSASAAERASEPGVTAAVFVSRSPEQFAPTLRSLAALPGLEVEVGVADETMLAVARQLHASARICPNAAALVNRVFAERGTPILVVSDAAVVPLRLLDQALLLAAADPRVATVSFLCNDAGFLSFPVWNGPADRVPDGHDEETVTKRLRSLPPEPFPAPLPVATGAVVLLTRSGLGAIGPLLEHQRDSFAANLAEYCQRGRQRGFLDLLDPGTFYTLPSDIRDTPRDETVHSGLTGPDNHWVNGLHPTFSAFSYDELTRTTAPLALAYVPARAKITGLRILVDGRCLGPLEMGTQVATLSIIDALAASEEVERVAVALPGPVPRYAERVFRDSRGAGKVVTHIVVDGDLSVFGRVDIGYRPYQPDGSFGLDRWREVADRVAVSVLDIIGYRIGSYSPNAEAWMAYRELMHRTVGAVDGVTVISHDVREQMQLEQFPIDRDRVFEVPLGTEHLTGTEKAIPPDVVVEKGLHAVPFLLCIGTNYTHKNRDLALRAHHELRRRGWELPLVLAGASVPYGTTRTHEASVGRSDDVIALPDVPSEQRNWLLRHASLVLYPTSAEGFGLVPFEAARFGTPTVYVSFGPLAEGTADVPVTATGWSPEAVADAAEALLRDPALAAQQVEATLTTGSSYTWPRAAQLLTTMFRTLLAWPPR
jgi:glycosyltransferase involved in cell wall biosynthesis